MQVLTTVAEMRSACEGIRRSGQSLGLVPTMGALHEGHLSLVREARQQCDTVAATIFVNPTQFAPGEDFTRYPRTFEADRALLDAEQTTLLFAPAPEEMYPPGASAFVDVPDVGSRLDGASRPGHFRGVATIVTKLFHITAPDKAFFGQKDAAQVAVLARMVRDLDFGVQLVVCPIVREADGLALSSRNRYLSPEERSRALVLSRSLKSIEAAYKSGECGVEQLLASGRAEIAREPEVRIDYFAMVDRETLLPLTLAGPGALVAVAAWVGTTRLIDNVIL